MDTKDSTASKSDDSKTTKQLFGSSIIPNSPRRSIGRMVQNVLLVWLDNNIDEGNITDCRNTLIQLRRVVNTIETFTDSEECIEFIRTIPNNDKACIIISGALGQRIVPRIHNMSQLDSIFIFCINQKYHEKWAKDWGKIKGVFTKIEPICEALKAATRLCEQNATPISLLATNVDTTKTNLNQLDCSFMYTLILKEILLTINFEKKHIKQFISYCRKQFADNDDELEHIRNVEKSYHKKTPIWWYTYESFLFGMLNRALRLTEVDIIIDMGFYINDLHRQIVDLNQKQYRINDISKTFTLYRGQGMDIMNFKQIKNTPGGLLSFNSFLSTTKNRSIARKFAIKSLQNPDLISILFVMTVNPSESQTVFADITDVSCVSIEDEVLFSMHTVFRIGDVKHLDNEKRFFEVHLTLTNNNDRDLRILTDRLRQDISPGETGWYRLGSLLLKMGQHNKAQQVYEILLQQTIDDHEKSKLYLQIGNVKHSQGKYNEAIKFFNDSLKISQKTIDSNPLTLAAIYNNMGCAYNKMHKYSDVLSSYERALALQQQSLPSYHTDLAASYNNIGNVYARMHQYSQALSSHEQALAIRQHSLPPNHPDLASTYNNIGNVYYNINEYYKARTFYERAIEIAQRSLPSYHPDLQMYKQNLSSVSQTL
ncbi:unnamed protein product [Rotaria sp. Silwood1]|nr:unnamed protein product [Rotaria sp. Silwood1]CAF4934809.1 unnamed protein product [Rotaria sp. Silwood1]